MDLKLLPNRQTKQTHLLIQHVWFQLLDNFPEGGPIYSSQTHTVKSELVAHTVR